MKRAAILLMAGVMALTMMHTVPAEEAAQEEAAFIQDISYMDDDEKFHKLDVHGTADGETKPVIVEVHGGAYIGGDKKLNTAHSEYYAQHGFAVVNTNYTTLSHGDFQNVVKEFTNVLHWVEDNAEEYGFDTEHVFMSGDSAGGYFVTLMAAVLNSEELQQYYGVTVPGFDVGGFILTCPGSDIRVIAEALDDEEGMSAKIAQQIGAEVLGDPDIVDHADIYTIVDPETFPEVYILTTPDDDVLYAETLRFHEFLEEKGITHVYTEYASEENQLEHVFNIGHTDWAESIKANDDAIAYLQSKCK